MRFQEHVTIITDFVFLVPVFCPNIKSHNLTLFPRSYVTILTQVTLSSEQWGITTPAGTKALN